ncbi:hypothetical protein CRENPOLYSF1_680003 [Crenothrix polyspora]|uniref:TonB C-terminal domain-containing protein n=1 Tax=Crenothrix polyspora TaxID=360316 RepID=A0A1R4HGI1_9GAMM|nr:hypothetical protein CRENPOLYSF1_680003 [Crenothrix polyspora]
MIQQKVTRNWVLPSDKHGSCSIRVRMSATGAVIYASASCTGDVIFNQSAENAVRKSSPLPVPSDRALALKEFRSITFNIHR